jgi:hypothetical protein
MKSIHVLPTDKPSKLFINPLWENQLRFVKNQLIEKKHKERFPQHIYITNSEEIKDGEYGICLNLVRQGFKSHQSVFKMDSEQRQAMKELGGQKKAEVLKVILSTDDTLIKDGVQAIDNTFLEWFVKNPSCESVETIYDLFNLMGRRVDPMNLGQNHSQCVWKYKIIIPKEEPKQIKCYCGHTTSCDCSPLEEPNIINDWLEKHGDPEVAKQVEKEAKELHEQSTLEEAAEKWYDSTEENKGFPKIKAFKDGAKWQSEKSYSREQVIELFNKYVEDIENPISSKFKGFHEWIQQNLKK